MQREITIADLTDAELAEVLRFTESTLQQLCDPIDQQPDVQPRLTELLNAQENILSTFERITAENRQMAQVVLLAAVVALTNTHSANLIRQELMRRTEGN